MVVESVERRSSLRKREKSAHSAHTGPYPSATSIQSSIASPHRLVVQPSFFVFARVCFPPPNQPIRSPGTPKKCAHRFSLHDILPCFDWHSRRRSNALRIASFLLPISLAIHLLLHARSNATKQHTKTQWVPSATAPPNLSSSSPSTRLSASTLPAPRRDARHEGEDVEF